jgi:flavin reductase (DIM6/NTAB) family NADH-FMN oxidoreductase RutF
LLPERTRKLGAVTEPSVELTPGVLRAAFGNFPSGITAVAAMSDGVPIGLAASSFTSVSIEPPLVSVCVAWTSTTWPLLRPLSRLGLSVLAEEHGPVARSLAAKGIDRFADIDWNHNEQGAVFVHGSALWLETTLWKEVPAGDHAIALLQIEGLWSYPDVSPLIFHGSTFRQLRSAES